MKRKPVYVETTIHAPIEKVWEYTQNPKLHEQWDLRFSTISLNEPQNEQPQSFLYEKHLGFGLSVTGTGAYRTRMMDERNERASSLKFKSSHPLSFIKEGSGYWKYMKTSDHIVFQTQFDYKTKEGKGWTWADRILFRPMIGFMTAFSFGALKTWLEKGTHPRLLLERTLAHYGICLLFAIVWLCQAVIPFSHSAFDHSTSFRLFYALLGVSWLIPKLSKKYLFILQSIFFLIMLCIGILSPQTTLHEPLVMSAFFILSIAGMINLKDCVDVFSIKRKRGGRHGRSSSSSKGLR
ncbi:hypothetical protein [Bacillus pumilus]|jgi:hypothetical protein|uniref:hypothetical protein n=1 Tax=Bacillus pumilus TaxID=1408 RepID=UPI00081FDEB2|nr:hypothetical protein [Bacillus pumilus]AOC56501.1 hypothetical protein BEN31_06720 [Bacillus pumilus]MBR0585875.1 hypothetical protein [Bacillus pumilus DW2J2]MBR0615678.1 hypothetical protein [Bacillus pumilus]MBR0623668.1 hypothetical protein [Bacillus pumilus]MCY7725677.1 hypothetical protein [Bacillus pumilus]